jgi:hypothetical protein
MTRQMQEEPGLVAGDLGGVVRVIDAMLTSELSPLPA